jgi:HlyD family secretion protein
VATEKQTTVSRDLRALFTIGRTGELTDGQLLERLERTRNARPSLAFKSQLGGIKAILVYPLPDPSSAGTRDVKVYTTRVKVENPPPGLRPGMSAEAEILVGEVDNVLTVPIEAVLHYDGKDHVAVKKPDGGFEWRDVTLGVTNDKVVEVKQGLKSGESVARNPSALMSEQEKREKLGPPAKAAPKPGAPR